MSPSTKVLVIEDGIHIRRLPRAALQRAGHVALEAGTARGGVSLLDLGLSPKEYGVLAELAKRAGRVISHAQLLRIVWGPTHASGVDDLRIVVRNLRQKLERDPARAVLIQNEPGVGYRLRPAWPRERPA